MEKGNQGGQRISQRATKGVPPKRNDAEGFQWRSLTPGGVQALRDNKLQEQPDDSLDGLEDWMVGTFASEEGVRKSEECNETWSTHSTPSKQKPSSQNGLSTRSLISMSISKKSQSVSSVAREKMLAEIEAQEELDKLEDERLEMKQKLENERLERKQKMIKMKLELKKVTIDENLDDSCSRSQNSGTRSAISKVSSWMDNSPPVQNFHEPIVTEKSTPKIVPPQSNNQELQSHPKIPDSQVHDEEIPETSSQSVVDVQAPNPSQSNGIEDLVKAMTGVFSQLQQPLVPRQQDSSSSTTTKFLARQTHAKDLPSFSGAPEEWISFIKAYERSTEICGFTDDENLHRLRKSLKGDALKTVQSLMNSPLNVSKMMKKLETRFGQPEHIIEAMTARARSVPAAKEEKLETVIEFGLTVDNLVSTMISLNCKDHLSNPQLLKELEKKLPVSYQVQWREWIVSSSNPKNLESFATWLNLKTEIACQLCPPKSKQESENKEDKHGRHDRRQVFAACEDTGAKENKKKTDTACYRCNRIGHLLPNCRDFAKDSQDARWQLVLEKKLCFLCLKPGHWTNKCLSKRHCEIPDCKRKHHTLLHNDRKLDAAVKEVVLKNEPDVKKLGHASKPGCRDTLLKILPVFLKGKDELPEFAFLDEGADVTLIEADAADELGLEGPKESLCLQWTNDVTRKEEDSRNVSVKISGAFPGAKTFEMRGVRTVKDLSLPSQSINLEDLAKQWPHLNCAQVQSFRNAQPRILIGSDNAHLIVSRQVVDGGQDSPLVSRTKLGWVVHGKDGSSISKPYRSFHICKSEDPDEMLHQLVKENFKTESFGVKVQNDKPRSREDMRAQIVLEDTTRRTGDRWETGLLWKSDEVILPDSRTTAFNRLKCVERKMDKDEKISKWYVDKIQDYLNKGYVRKLTPEEAAVTTQRTWYLPHFFAFHPHKPEKPRLVFDAAAKSQGQSLNDNLVQGPDLLNPLPSVLFKFREKKYGFTGDIKEMFHQVRIRKEDLPSQRFLWRGLDRDREPDTYEIPVLFFGATSSPSSAIFVKNLNALEFRDEYPEAYQAIVDYHYMDDYLSSSDTEEEGSKLIDDVIKVYAKGGFNICNWTSSSRNILDKIPEELRASEVKELDSGDDLPTGRVLGLWWDHERDAFTWILKFHKVKPEIVNGTKTPTKREVLKLVMSLFDPLGFLAHFIIKAKILLQAIWRTEIGWDDEISSQLNERWQMWLEELKTIVEMKIPRCYSIHFSKSEKNQLHIFCDASEEAFSAVAYFRVESDEGIEVAFVAARTRVAPLKPMSIPRLELQAAVMASRLSETIKQDHTVKISKTFFWSDSRTVLSWIRADAKRFKPFVSHRIGEIEELTDAADWNWVPTKENVSDDATRSSTPSDLSSSSRWLNGPDFLKLDSTKWPKEAPELTSADEKDVEELEIRKQFVSTIVSINLDVLPDVARFSSWNRLIRATAWILRFVDNLKNPKIRSLKPNELTPVELMDAEKLWWKKAQKDSFEEELQLLTSKKDIPKSSRLKLLSPFTDTNGILRVSGRLEKSPDADEWTKKPIILDPKHPYTILLIKYYHERVGHQGQEMVVNELRQKYWILNLRAAVKKVSYQCQDCRNKKSQPQLPEMGQLPEARVTGNMPAFTFTGMDYFGPMEVTIGRRHEKRYGVLFTCMTTRAVHLEIAASLTTDSAVMAIRRFAARRGHPQEMFSDNGTNLRGAEKELRLALEELNQENIQQQLTTMGITWHFNPPAAPHMGGIWERLVRSVKTALKVTLNERAPREEVLQTLFTEAEAIVNSRPLTHVSVDPKDPEALTPNHFLLGKSSGMPSPGRFTDDDLCLRRQWRISQRMADQFWTRWRKEYLPVILRRTKWHGHKESVKVGDVVLVVEDQASRNSWPLGLVTAVYPGRDGVIRVVDVKTTSGMYRRPVAKICKLDVNREEVKEDFPLRGPECCDDE